MKLHKTPLKDRDTYTFKFYDANGKPQPVTVRPGEDGVTEIDIKRLHSLDDSEIYYNLKAINPEMSLTENERKELRQQKEEWKAQYIADFKAEYGYEPHPQDIQDAMKTAFPKNWLSSIDGMTDGDDENDGYGDKSSFLYDVAASDEDEPMEVDRLRAIVAGMDERWQYIYQQVLIMGVPRTVVAAQLDISEARVRQIIKKIETRIAEDKILQKIFR